MSRVGRVLKAVVAGAFLTTMTPLMFIAGAINVSGAWGADAGRFLLGVAQIALGLAYMMLTGLLATRGGR